jgi:hypothetical protein
MLNKLIALAVAAGVLTALAPAQVFNFEGEAGGPHDAGALTSLSMTKGGVTVTIVRSSGERFDVVDNTVAGQTGKPPTWGSRSLSPFFNATNGDFFIATFSTTVTNVSIQFGDYGADSDTGFLRAFDGIGGTGSLLDSDSFFYGTSSFPIFGMLDVSGIGIRSIAFGNVAGDDFVPSLFWDNLVLRGADVIPAPAAVLPFALGLLAAWRRKR